MTVPTTTPTATTPPATTHRDPPALRDLADVERWLDRELTASAALGRGPGLPRARHLLRMLDDPQDRVPVVHVAGTAGKGSVASFVAALLHAHGKAVGAHLSPHVHDLGERFRLGAGPAPGPLVAATLDAMRPVIEEMTASPWGAPTYFEVTNAVAFRVFADRAVDHSVVETGIGGRHDATNAISRADKLAVLTRIGFDHTEILGPTLADIARQKAGILPRGGTALAERPTDREVEQVLRAEADGRGCRLELVDPPAAARHAGGWSFDHRGTRIDVGPPGRHQVGNAALALRAVELLAARDGWQLDAGAVRVALRDTVLPGRFERRHRRGREVVLDGAHNPVKLAALVATVGERHPGLRPVWVVAMRPDKDVRAALEVVASCAGAVVATELPVPAGDRLAGRTVPAHRLARCARAAGIAHVEAEPDVTAALDRAAELAPPGHPVIVAGSFHLVGAAGRVLADPGGTPRPEHGSEHGPRRQDGPGTVGRARGAGR